MAGTLLDLWDGPPNDGYDTYTLDFDKIWNTFQTKKVDGDNAETFREFYDLWLQNGYSQVAFLNCAKQNTIEYNKNPVLTNGSVNPAIGTTATIFTYQINYYDADGNSPTIKNVYIDSASHTMALLSGIASNGTYSYTQMLSEGTHDYFFSFDDGYGGNARYPTAGAYTGPSVSGVTPPPVTAPAVTNSTGASNITSTSARLNGEVTATGGESPTVHIYWGDNDGGTTPSSWDNNINLGTRPESTFYFDIAGLTPSNTYYYRCYATNSAGTTWASSTSSFVAQNINKLIGAGDASGLDESVGYFRLTRWQAAASGFMTEFRVKAGASGHVKCALYQDNNGAPGALITAMNTGQAVVPGWNTLSFNSTWVSSGVPYWLGICFDVQGAVRYIDGGTYRYKAATYSTFNFPDQAGSSFTSGAYTDLTAGWGMVGSPPLTITTTSLLDGMVDTPYSQTLQVSGGSGTYTWSIITGSLPAGLSLNSSTGLISGTSTAIGTSDFTVQVNDGLTTDEQALSITVNCNLAVTGEGSQISPYLHYSGGAGNYTNLNSDDDGLSSAYHQQPPAGGIHESCFNMQDISTSSSIDSVTLYIELCAYTTGHLKPYVRISDLNYYGDEQTITGYSGQTRIWYTKGQSWATNPATGQTWTQLELNNAEFGFWTNFGVNGCEINYMYLEVDTQ